MGKQQSGDGWNSKIGMILAVAGSAVGLGNFLRFPGVISQNGGGICMIPYLVSFLILGLPVCWAEWIMGKWSGSERNYHSTPAIFYQITKSKFISCFGALGLLVPLGVYTYYILIESWCLAYAYNYLTGDFSLGNDPMQYSAVSASNFSEYTGSEQNGFLLNGGIHQSVVWWAIVFALNFYLIGKGLSKGIEKFCKVAMPLMGLCAIIVLIRVLTLGTPNPELPDQNVINGLGFMWNPKPIEGKSLFESLLNPQIWIASAGQIFFSLSIGFGVIINYASYLKKKDDVVLSSLTANSTNEFFEVCLGGLITIPATFIFLGAAATQGSTFSLGFVTLPVVFQHMPLGRMFACLWFFMLFLAAITSSLSMLQPVIAFFSEAFSWSRKVSSIVLSLISAFGSLFIMFFSKDLLALDVVDFWIGTLGIYLLAVIQVFIFIIYFGSERGLAYANSTGTIKIPKIFIFTIKYITPTYLIIIFASWIYTSLGEQLEKFSHGGVPLYSIIWVITLLSALLILTKISLAKWEAASTKENS